jgi:hypothetical protein
MKKVQLRKSDLFALVDDEDYDRVSKYRWTLEIRKNGLRYARASVSGKVIRLHRFILNLRPGVGSVDHEDGDGLNNTKKNLLETTRAENVRNGRVHSDSTSRYKGVLRVKLRWMAKLILGTFDTEEEAAAAYRKAFQAYFGRPPRYPSKG